ncbi:hypothetical protein ASPVEDRAFT_32920 [Aspergillus versicolor CBS 583.65]|uniref:Peptidase S33 tripeptidyl aminopeptidase-like C-terminal domain-containing protein n=1 Tax=Aspergillus versicolor CBS 583.65 TaxID=1036611 RepID=A0A1L9PYK9_ASPVE|nr:uncharacterized protein ASPVEDRAFT_32920 [Aspergillus versicolor CBS 583.65]OJJ06631.1 hypothetical protein ASPVEDRAFT_32920 [Aspergillus versicolor CBS 583.65]
MKALYFTAVIAYAQAAAMSSRKSPNITLNDWSAVADTVLSSEKGNIIGVLYRSFDVTPPKTGSLVESILATRYTVNLILFITIEIDPVAPKRGVYRMASVFSGSTVLSQNSPGYTIFASAPTCLLEKLQKYILREELPPANTTCQPDVKPFQGES